MKRSSNLLQKHAPLDRTHAAANNVLPQTCPHLLQRKKDTLPRQAETTGSNTHSICTTLSAVMDCRLIDVYLSIQYYYGYYSTVSIIGHNVLSATESSRPQNESAHVLHEFVVWTILRQIIAKLAESASSFSDERA